MSTRQINRIISAVATADGAGVRLRRSLGSGPQARLDPFLMLDEFSSDNPDDYIAGFPSHPHRGFETVTYLLEGHMLHQDHLGNRGDLQAGDVQWMTAGRGVIHSEMPQQTEGRLRGFQLWLNLPARDKMQPAAYRDIPAAAIPEVDLGPGASARLIAGRLEYGGEQFAGPVQGSFTDPHYFDISLAGGAGTELALPRGHAAFVYLVDGAVDIGRDSLARYQAGLLGDGDAVNLRAGAGGGRLLLLAARPIGEPVVQYGPFVMNSREEIEQALADYRDGSLTREAG